MNKITKILISIFLVINFLTMIRVHLPFESKFVSKAFFPIDKYLSFFSIYQDWFMFAPNPARRNYHVTAHIEFIDGTSDTYDFGRNDKMSILQKYSYGERFRKFTSEGMSKESNSWMWRDVAKFALRKVKHRNFNKIPLKVRLVSHLDVIPEVHVEMRKHMQKPKKYQTNTFFTYEVI